MATFIITRHQGAIEWLKAKGFEGKVLPHLTLDDVNKDDVVVGVLPTLLAVRLIEKGVRVLLLELPDLPPEYRGKELTPELMDRFGASVWELGVRRVCYCSGEGGDFAPTLTGCNCCDCATYTPALKRVI